MKQNGQRDYYERSKRDLVNQEALDLKVKNPGGETQVCKIKLKLRRNVIKQDHSLKMLKIRRRKNIR